jgi:hypothetical protein
MLCNLKYIYIYSAKKIKKIPDRFNNSRIPLGVHGKNKGSQLLLAKFPRLIA